MSEKTVQVELIQQHDYVFEARFGDAVPPLRCDEPAPLGQGSGPSPVQLLTAAVANCLSDSLLFALRKFKQSPEPIRCVATSEVGRNAEGLEHLDRVLSSFEAYCTVTQSVGLPVRVEVFDATGRQLK
jgi:organic hydroperoxide reductase OsmC/OhrA